MAEPVPRQEGDLVGADSAHSDRRAGLPVGSLDGDTSRVRTEEAVETAAADDSDHEAIVSDRMQWRSPGMGTPLTAGAYIRNRTQSHEWEGSGCGFSGLVCWVRS